MKKILIFLIVLILPILSLAQSEYFNPFKYGIQTVKGIGITNEDFRNAVRTKAVEILNKDFKANFNTTTEPFQTSDSTIISTNPDINVNEVVRELYGGWRELIRKAAEEVVNEPHWRNTFKLGNLPYVEITDVEISGGKLTKLYVGMAKYSGVFPVVDVCKQGIGQCLLFLFDRALRILYTGALILGVIFLMWAGILYISHPTKVEETHKRFYWGIIGIAVAIISFSVVIGLERWIASGISGEIARAPQEENDETTPTDRIFKNSLYIDISTAKLIEVKTENKIKFVVYVEPSVSATSCEVVLSLFNKSKGEHIVPPYTSTKTIDSPQYLTENIDPDKLNPGDELRVVFRSDCSLNISYIDLAYGQKGTPPPKEYPSISEFDIQEIRAQQYLSVELPEDFSDLLEEILKVAIIRRNIYQPPFYAYINYNVATPTENGSCTLYGTIRGMSASSFDPTKTKVTSFYIFNRDFSINLDYTKGKSFYKVSRFLPLPSNTLGFIYLKIYDYSGQCSDVKFGGNSILTKSYEKVFDIETGKIYVGDTLNEILKNIFKGF